MLWRRAQEEQETIDGSGCAVSGYGNRKLSQSDSPASLAINSISPDISFQIKVIKDPNLNAFAFPDGVIYVHTGILARMDNEAQLAALLAHEMVHCTHRHSLRIAAKHQRPAHRQKPQTLPEISLSFLAVTGSMASINGYTRELETEADRVGLDLAVKANYDPRETLKLFELLKQEIDIEGIEEPYFFGTHPNVQQRIENINNWLVEKYQGKITGIKNSRHISIQDIPVGAGQCAPGSPAGKIFRCPKNGGKIPGRKTGRCPGLFSVGRDIQTAGSA